MRLLLPAAAAVALLLTGCSSSDSDDPDPSEANTQLRSANEVNAESAIALGEFAPVGLEGHRIQISDPEVGGNEAGPWLEVTVRSENTTDNVVGIPNVNLWCANTNEGGGSQWDSTISPGDQVPAGAFREGVMNLLPPGGDRINGNPGAVCEEPAYIEATPTGEYAANAPPARWVLPTDLIYELNGALDAFVPE